MLLWEAVKLCDASSTGWCSGISRLLRLLADGCARLIDGYCSALSLQLLLFLSQHLLLLLLLLALYNVIIIIITVMSLN